MLSDLLSHAPSSDLLAWIRNSSIALGVITLTPIMLLIRDTPDLWSGAQYKFSADFIRREYAAMTAAQVRRYYIAGALDIVFAFTYSSLLFALAVGAARQFDTGSAMQSVGYAFALCGLLAGLCDCAEQVLFLKMNKDPQGFPGWFAVAHSSFSAVKYISGALPIVYLVISHFQFGKTIWL